MKKSFISFCFMMSVLTGYSQTIDSLSVTAIPPKDLTASSTVSPYVQGTMDAERYYKKYKGAGTGTLITSLVSPLVGLIPAIACSASAPKLSNLGYPDENQFKTQEYYLAYTEKAKKIKKKKVWTNWGIGFGVNLVAVLAITAAANN